MSEDKKKEYLKLNFIQPLSDNLPLSSEYFNNSGVEQCFSLNENFANYIQFDLKSITEDFIQKINSQHSQKLHASGNKDINGGDPILEVCEIQEMSHFPQKEFNFGNINLRSGCVKNLLLKFDVKIEFNIEKFCKKIDELCNRDNNLQDAVRYI
jgi:hypothetical protein